MTLTKKGRQILQTLITARNAVNHTHPYVCRKMVPMHPLLAQILTIMLLLHIFWLYWFNGERN